MRKIALFLPDRAPCGAEFRVRNSPFRDCYMEEKAMNQSNPVRTFRLGALAELLDRRARQEQEKAAVIVRRALREYLGKGNSAPDADIARLIAALEQTRLDLSRIGGNLNQIAHALNIDERLKNPTALEAVHADLIQQFPQIVHLLLEIRDDLRRDK